MRPPAVARCIVSGLACLLCLAAMGAFPLLKHAPRRVEVKIEDLKYHPGVIEIGLGDTVVWTNNDDAEHSVKADDGSFNSGRLGSGKTFEHKFDKPGRFIYSDDLHPRMKGTIVVTEQ